MFDTLALRGFFSTSTSAKNKKQAIFASAKPGQFWLAGILIALNVFLLMSYLVGVNSNAANGYEIKKLQQRAGQLSEDNKTMSVKVSEISSIVQIQADLANSDFVPVTGAQYLQVNQLSQR